MPRQLTQIAKFDLPPTFPDDLVAAVASLTPQHVLLLAKRELDPAGVLGAGRGPR